MSITAKGRIATTRRKNSTNGNASFAVCFVIDEQEFDGTSIQSPDGYIVQGVTRPNSQFTTTMPRDGRAECTWHVTPSGRVIFDNIKHVGK